MRCARVVIGLGLSLVLSTAIAGEVVSSEAAATLGAMTRDFSAARSAPLGIWPGPPDIDFATLQGLSASAIRAALGVPDTYEKGMSPPDCDAKLCWSFRYGPGPAPLKGPHESSDGAAGTDVRSGGPWLLIFGFENDHVVSVYWHRQR